MFRGFYTVASGMLSQQRRTEMLSNNLANINTPGFKADQSSLRAFPEMLLNQMEQANISTDNSVNAPLTKTVGAINTGVYMQEAIPNFIQGDVRETGQKTDVSLMDITIPGNADGTKGTVFFTIQNKNGEIRYTRNGDFTLDGQGFLTTASGLYVLDDQGNPIQLNSDQFTIDNQGNITGNNGENAKLGIAYSDNPQSLLKEGDGLFRTENGQALANANNTNGVVFKLQQGYLEGSNVDASKMMTEMMTAYRAFEANQKVLQAYDKSMEKAANEIGRL